MISVIVPVCNVETFVEQCVRSLMNQTYKDLEIICINDGSKDSSLDILRSLEKEDQRIRVIDKPNAGYGHTINTGLRAAKGEYVGILESDDFAEPDMYEKLYQAISRYDADLVKANFYSYYVEDGHKEFTEYLAAMEYDCLAEKNDHMLLLGPTIWAGLYRRQFLLDNDIWLLETPGASYQDTSFAFKVMYAAKKVTFIRDAVLNYRCDNAASSVNSNSKVFFIREELAEEKRFLMKFESGIADLPILSRIRLLRYRWNLDRLEGANKLKFLLMMYEDFRRDDLDGYLVRARLWSEQDWYYIHKLIYDFDDFAKDILGDSVIIDKYDRECQETKLNILRLQDGVSVMGTGTEALDTCHYLRSHAVRIKRFIGDGQTYIEGLPVEAIEQAKQLHEDIIVIPDCAEDKAKLMSDLEQRYMSNYVVI